MFYINETGRDGFLDVGKWARTIKLAMAITSEWWHRFPLFLVY